jgi:hypothetical protein
MLTKYMKIFEYQITNLEYKYKHNCNSFREKSRCHRSVTVKFAICVSTVSWDYRDFLTDDWYYNLEQNFICPYFNYISRYFSSVCQI